MSQKALITIGILLGFTIGGFIPIFGVQDVLYGIYIFSANWWDFRFILGLKFHKCNYMNNLGE